MDHLSSMFPLLFSTEFLQALVSIALATVVFFYFVHLLRKEEDAGQTDAERITPEAVDMRRQS